MIMAVMMVLWVMVISMVSLVIVEISAYTTTIPTLTNTRFQTTRIPRIQQPQIRPSKFAIFTVFSSANDSSNSSGGGLVQQTDSIMKKQLLNAFTNLGTADQYDAVLTGLCAKVLDDTNAITPDTTIVAIQDCTDLLEEMNASKITASSRSLMALIDATTKTQSATCMARVIRLCIRNSFGSKQYGVGIQQYGQQQRDIRILPMSNYNQKILCPDGSRKTVQERLDSYEDIPTDDERIAEVTSAGLFGATVVTSEIINLFSVNDSIEHWVTSAVLTLMISVTIIDNGYDFINMASQFALSQMKMENKEKFQLPDKGSLPLNLGQGMITGSIVRGFTRLLTIDPIREAQCEAAALYTAYALGLPCYPYRPNAFEASVLVAESAAKDVSASAAPPSKGDDGDADNLLTSSGILRILMWLYAPIVIEYMNHPQLIISDPKEASGFLQRLEDYYGSTDTRLFWLDDNNTQNRDNLLKWAYMESDVLIRNNKQLVLELSDRLASGAATIGDCVAVIEGWE